MAMCFGIPGCDVALLAGLAIDAEPADLECTC